MAGREEVEKEKESVIQKRRSLHSGHVWRRHTLYGAITYALLSRQGGRLYASVRRATDRAGKNGKARRRESVCTRHGWNGGDMIFQFGQKI